MQTMLYSEDFWTCIRRNLQGFVLWPIRSWLLQVPTGQGSQSVLAAEPRRSFQNPAAHLVQAADPDQTTRDQIWPDLRLQRVVHGCPWMSVVVLTELRKSSSSNATCKLHALAMPWAVATFQGYFWFLQDAVVLPCPTCWPTLLSTDYQLQTVYKHLQTSNIYKLYILCIYVYIYIYIYICNCMYMYPMNSSLRQSNWLTVVSRPVSGSCTPLHVSACISII